MKTSSLPKLRPLSLQPSLLPPLLPTPRKMTPPSLPTLHLLTLRLVTPNLPMPLLLVLPVQPLMLQLQQLLPRFKEEKFCTRMRTMSQSTRRTSSRCTVCGTARSLS